MTRTLYTRFISAAGLLLLVMSGLLVWSWIHHRHAFAQVQAQLSESTQERNHLRHDLAAERQRLRGLEQIWSRRLEIAQSEKLAAEQRLRECESRK
jgi:hypothetical protein